jgi:hypothetical protein
LHRGTTLRDSTNCWFKQDNLGEYRLLADSMCKVLSGNWPFELEERNGAFDTSALKGSWSILAPTVR